MDINRNQFFTAGLVILLLGLQFRVVDTVTLNPKFTRLMAETSGTTLVAAADPLLGATGTTSPMTVRPPDWLGWSLLSLGSVLILHAMAMPKPAG